MNIEDLKVDLTQEIEGFTEKNRETCYGMPLISHIMGNLWMGGCIDDTILPKEFDYVLSLYPWEKYLLHETTIRAEIALYDRAELPDLPSLFSAAGYVLGAIQKGPTLVHCQAGLNRSGLVVALAMILSGTDPETAIAVLREKRHEDVLCNSVFADWIKGLRITPVI
jgi:protein tyrosine phosphatase